MNDMLDYLLTYKLKGEMGNTERLVADGNE